MKRGFLLWLPCLLLTLYCSSCQRKCHEDVHSELRSDFIPYVNGDGFDLICDAGRVVHFTVNSYVEDVISGTPNSVEQVCVDEAARMLATIGTDSAGVSLTITEYGNDDVEADAFEIQWANGVYLRAVVSNSGISDAFPLGSVSIGNRTYDEVFKMVSPGQLPTVTAKTIWYNRTDGLLKIEFTDSTAWTIVN